MQIQIADEVGTWLEQMAAADGKSAEEYASEALRQFLEDRADYKLAVERDSEEGEVYSLEDIEREACLDAEVQTKRS